MAIPLPVPEASPVNRLASEHAELRATLATFVLVLARGSSPDDVQIEQAAFLLARTDPNR